MKFIGKHIGHIAAITVILSILAVLGIAIFNEVQQANANAAFGHTVIVKTPEKVTTVYPFHHPGSPPPANVPSAWWISVWEKCKDFQNIAVGNSAVSGIVLDEGSCYIGHTKYAIDTFQNKMVRDTWLKMARPYGVVPKFETRTSVTYKSVDS